MGQGSTRSAMVQEAWFEQATIPSAQTN